MCSGMDVCTRVDVDGSLRLDAFFVQGLSRCTIYSGIWIGATIIPLQQLEASVVHEMHGPKMNAKDQYCCME